MFTWLQKSTVFKASHSLKSSPGGNFKASLRVPLPQAASIYFWSWVVHPAHDKQNNVYRRFSPTTTRASLVREENDPAPRWSLLFRTKIHLVPKKKSYKKRPQIRSFTKIKSKNSKQWYKFDILHLAKSSRKYLARNKDWTWGLWSCLSL